MLIAQQTIAKDTTRGLRTQHNKHLNKHKQTNDIEEDVAFFTQTLQGGNNNASTRKARKAKIIHTSKYNMNGNQGNDITEDVAFWTRALQNSMPPTPRPPTPRPPTPRPPTPRPPTPRPPTPPTPPPPTPTPPTPPTPTPPPPTPTFNCPPASFVGCTAPDPSDFEDECPTVGEPCPGSIRGEFCCRDGCPRNYCTAKEFLTPAPVPVPVNVPVARPDSGSLQRASVFRVLNNDTPAQGDSLTVNRITRQASNGQCTSTADDPSLSSLLVAYVANPGFTVGTDSCDYEACDSQSRCDTATITFNVSPPPPTTPFPTFDGIVVSVYFNLLLVLVYPEQSVYHNEQLSCRCIDTACDT